LIDQGILKTTFWQDQCREFTSCPCVYWAWKSQRENCAGRVL